VTPHRNRLSFQFTYGRHANSARSVLQERGCAVDLGLCGFLDRRVAPGPRRGCLSVCLAAYLGVLVLWPECPPGVRVLRNPAEPVSESASGLAAVALRATSGPPQRPWQDKAERRLPRSAKSSGPPTRGGAPSAWSNRGLSQELPREVLRRIFWCTLARVGRGLALLLRSTISTIFRFSAPLALWHPPYLDQYRRASDYTAALGAIVLFRFSGLGV
jgi:hypothetical protein